MSHPIMRWFDWRHLSGYPAEVSSWFESTAVRVNLNLPDGPEKSTALRKLLEAKDAAVRAALDKGEG